MNFCIIDQAIPSSQDAGIQTNENLKANAISQYEPRGIDGDVLEHCIQSTDLESFLRGTVDDVEHCLLQNEVVDILGDELVKLEKEEAGIDESSGNILQEVQSFTDLSHSKNKAVSALDWIPGTTVIFYCDSIQNSNDIFT